MRFSRRDFLYLLFPSYMALTCKKQDIPTLTITYPEGNEIISAQEKIVLKWLAFDIDKIDLSYTIDNGKSWTSIVQALNASEEKFEWLTPKINTDGIKIKINTNNTNMVQATSESFEIWQSFIIKFFDYPDLAVVPTKIIIKDKFFDSVAIERKSVDTFTVLSLSCTHAGCTLDKVNDNLECPCHGSVFTENGCVLQGPARSSLSFYTYLFDKDKESLVVFRKAIKNGC